MNLKRFSFLLAAFATLHLAAPAHATDAGACYSIGDADARTYCLAKTRQNSSMCYAIQRADMRAACLAEVRSK